MNARKPLELDIWERTTCADGCGDRTWLNMRTGAEIDRDRRDHSPNLTRRDYNPAKRLTDAELAAEYWFMDAVMADQMARAASGYVAPRDVLSARADFEVIKRFAIHPHYDEADQ